jgi:hypothetical protein
MFRIIFRVALVLCLFAAPVVITSCARERTEIETHEEVLSKESRTIVTGDNE